MRKTGFRVESHWVNKACPVCGTRFEVRKSDPRVHCSWKCAQVTKGLKGRRRVEKVCKNCGKDFWVHRAHADAEHRNRGKHTGQFCSRSCTYEYWKTHPDEHPSKRKIGIKYGADYKYRDLQGYVVVRHPRGGRIKEHRLLMEQILGRSLQPWENIHHKNGVRDDNRPENLEVWVVNQPAGQANKYLNEIVMLRLRIAELESK